MNREAWLAAAVLDLRTDFEAVGLDLPGIVHVSVGWPSTGGTGKAGGSKAIGQCWCGTASADGAPHVFISPLLGEPLTALETLVHELAHAAVGTKAKHGPVFKRAAMALGLEGKATSTFAGAMLKERLAALAEHLGPYPHAPLSLPDKESKQSTRLLKAECGCGYIIRVTRKWVDQSGLPTCACGGEFAMDDAAELDA